jgi:hypothetical protein
VPRLQPAKQEPQLLWRSDSPAHAAARGGSLDGCGAGDHDQPYRFGWHPRSSLGCPFSTRQHGRLPVLRSRLQDGLLGVDDVDA